jgi:DNA repair exonuclease SbcCD ATPase subunit
VEFGSIRELLRLRDGAVTSLVTNLLERHEALQASLGLSGWDSAPAGEAPGKADKGAGGSGRAGTARVRRLRDGASVFAVKVADVADVFDSLDSILRRVRLAEEGRATSATIMRLQGDLATAKAELEEKEVDRLQLEERFNALKQSTSGGPTTQALEIDAQLLRAQQTRAVLRTRDQEVETLLRECNEQREHNEALQREMTTLKARLGSTREALRPRVAEVEARTREGLTAVQDLRQSLDLLAGMYQRVCDQLASSKRSIEELTEERERLAKALHGEVKRVGLLTGEVARMDAVNVRLMAAHDSLRAAYRRSARASGGERRPVRSGDKGGGAAAAVEEEEQAAMVRLAAGVSSVAREALERLRMVSSAGGDGSIVALEGLKRVIDVCSTARGTGELLQGDEDFAPHLQVAAPQ